eukprot:205518-Chlamydomonas_euryale.AAC.1
MVRATPEHKYGNLWSAGRGSDIRWRQRAAGARGPLAIDGHWQLRATGNRGPLAIEGRWQCRAAGAEAPLVLKGRWRQRVLLSNPFITPSRVVWKACQTSWTGSRRVHEATALASAARLTLPPSLPASLPPLLPPTARLPRSPCLPPSIPSTD